MPDVPPEEQLLAVAERAARAAGAELMQRFGRKPVDVRSKSTPTDPVSAADVAAERAVRQVLATERPGDAVLGEEGGEASPDTPEGAGGQLRWVVDPLDGTVNFLYGIPQFAVSVACEDRLGTLAGVVLDPVREECFKATRNGPALLGRKVLSPDRHETLERMLVATGFAYDPTVRGLQGEVVMGLLGRVRDIRRGGAAALDLSWCASGRVDAYYERGLRLWDFAAGALLCMRSGLVVRRLPARTTAGGSRLPDGLVVAAPALIDELEALVA